MKVLILVTASLLVISLESCGSQDKLIGSTASTEVVVEEAPVVDQDIDVQTNLKPDKDIRIFPQDGETDGKGGN
ncbi:MAG: hypothetical protein KDC99_19435 [Cyclobacteriaceae bacterium]|nr:hypothetical protein [Cyclobacteriaceae bacterium]